MASLVLTIKGSGVSSLKQDSSCDHEAIRDIVNHLNSLASGSEKGTIYAQSSSSDPVAASGTATLVSCATDTITIGNITFTGTGSPTTELHFETDGNDTADAAALAAAINAHSTLSKVVVATSASNVVTITSLIRGVVGNFIALSETGSTITVSGTALTGGTGGSTNTASTYAFGE
jgi:phage tail sheath gpL-like